MVRTGAFTAYGPGSVLGLGPMIPWAGRPPRIFIHQVSQRCHKLGIIFYFHFLVCAFWDHTKRIVLSSSLSLWLVILRMRSKQMSQCSVNTQPSTLPSLTVRQLFVSPFCHWGQCIAGNLISNFTLFETKTQGLVSFYIFLAICAACEILIPHQGSNSFPMHGITES